MRKGILGMFAAMAAAAMVAAAFLVRTLLG